MEPLREWSKIAGWLSLTIVFYLAVHFFLGLKLADTDPLKELQKEVKEHKEAVVAVLTLIFYGVGDLFDHYLFDDLLEPTRYLKHYRDEARKHLSRRQEKKVT